MRKKNLRKRQRALSLSLPLYHSSVVRDSMHLHAYVVNDSIERNARSNDAVEEEER